MSDKKPKEFKVVADAKRLPLKASLYAGQTGILVEVDTVHDRGEAICYHKLRFANGDIAAYLATEITEADTIEKTAEQKLQNIFGKKHKISRSNPNSDKSWDIGGFAHPDRVARFFNDCTAKNITSNVRLERPSLSTDILYHQKETAILSLLFTDEQKMNRDIDTLGKHRGYIFHKLEKFEKGLKRKKIKDITPKSFPALFDPELVISRDPKANGRYKIHHNDLRMGTELRTHVLSRIEKQLKSYFEDEDTGKDWYRDLPESVFVGNELANVSFKIKQGRRVEISNASNDLQQVLDRIIWQKQQKNNKLPYFVAAFPNKQFPRLYIHDDQDITAEAFDYSVTDFANNKTKNMFTKTVELGSFNFIRIDDATSSNDAVNKAIKRGLKWEPIDTVLENKFADAIAAIFPKEDTAILIGFSKCRDNNEPDIQVTVNPSTLQQIFEIGIFRIDNTESDFGFSLVTKQDGAGYGQKIWETLIDLHAGNNVTAENGLKAIEYAEIAIDNSTNNIADDETYTGIGLSGGLAEFEKIKQDVHVKAAKEALLHAQEKGVESGERINRFNHVKQILSKVPLNTDDDATWKLMGFNDKKEYSKMVMSYYSPAKGAEPQQP
ncbi:MAG: hypothetical protein GY941_22590 [Planctomycetes bacterium]|nr:hypothetical protein [Planctomycetota bacterium]